MSANTLDGALVMALFALGASLSMLAGPWLWLRLGGGSNCGWGIRPAGLAPAASDSWAIWMGLAHDKAPWRLTP